MYVCRYAKTAANFGSTSAGVNAQDMSKEPDCYKKFPVSARWGGGTIDPALTNPYLGPDAQDYQGGELLPAAPYPSPMSSDVCSTACSQFIPQGSVTIEVNSIDGFSIGMLCGIDIGTLLEEWRTIVGFGSIIFDRPLDYDHQAGAVISSASGGMAPLDAAGFLSVTNLCCPMEMEVFFIRLLDARGLAVCSKEHVQGLMHWFHCVPDMDFQYVLDVIDNGNPCKYWAPKGEACPALSEECGGKWCR